MPARKLLPDLVPGQKFGLWTVVAAVKEKPGRLYLCRCECGTEKEVPIYALRSGSSQSCGCQRPRGSWANPSTRWTF